MLKNIDNCISPELLKTLCEMGHGDEIVLADANFPSESLGKKVIRADGISGRQMLSAIMRLIPLDTYADQNYFFMQVVKGDDVEPKIWQHYKNILTENDPNAREGQLERFEFYQKAKQAYAVIATGEQAIYANVILKKGVL